MTVTIGMGGHAINHRVLVADVADDVILGMDLLNKMEVTLDLKQGIIRIGDEELVLHQKDESSVRILLAEDVTLPAKSENVVKAYLDGNRRKDFVGLTEQLYNDQASQGLLIGKVVVKDNKLIPIRVMNIHNFPKRLKKDTHVGWCCPISSVVHCLKTSTEVVSMKCPPKLEELVSMVCEDLTPEQRDKVKTLLCQYQDVFASEDGPLGRTNLVRHKIDTGDARPIKQHPRRLPFAKRDEAENIVNDMQKQGIIEPSSSPWASPVVLVRKKDGTTRFCVDYRQLNNVTKKDSYPLPRIDDTLDTLVGAQMFSTLDLKSGYWQVGLEPEEREKTAFTIGTGLWQFTVLPFGLCNAPATFERLMENVLRGLSWKTCLVYLDDVIVIGKSFDDHLNNLEQVFQRLRSAHLKLNIKKCRLFQTAVKYLGHIVSKDGVAADPDKTRAVQEWPIPKDKHELRCFLGLCTYYRRFVYGFANVAKALTKLTEEARPFKWDEECQSAFELLKQALVTAPVLVYPQPEGLFILDTDASNVGIGGVISQLQEGQEKVIGYFSKVLSKPERNYCVTRRELLAVVKSMEHFYKYLYGRKFLLRTDHAALKWLLQFKNPEGQVARWIERLQEYDFNVEHRAGNKHRNADTLSRRPCSEGCKHCSRLDDKFCSVRRTAVENEAWTPKRLSKDQEEDPDLQFLIKWKIEERRPTWAEISSSNVDLKAYWAQWDSLQLQGGVLMRCVENSEGTALRRQFVIPKNRIAEVLQHLHDGSSGGHLGVKRTLAKVRERFYWKNCQGDVKDWCKKCKICAAANGPVGKKRAAMRQYNVGSPFERIAIDISGPFPESDLGNKYILVAMDYFTKWVEAYPLPNQEAVTIAEYLVREFVSRFGVPLELHSDQGRNFESNIFQEVCRLLGINKTRTTALHPQSDGMVERMNRTIGKHLSKVVSENQKDWDKHLPLFLMAYRSSVHETTGNTPACVLFGREMRLPCDLAFGSRPGEQEVAGGDYVVNLRKRMNEIHGRVRENIQVASDRMKQYYDIKAQEGGFQDNEFVWLYNPQKRRGLCPKFQKFWDGPYLIVKRINDIIYRIRKLPHGKPKVVHFNRLAPYLGTNMVDEK